MMKQLLQKSLLLVLTASFVIWAGCPQLENLTGRSANKQQGIHNPDWGWDPNWPDGPGPGPGDGYSGGGDPYDHGLVPGDSLYWHPDLVWQDEFNGDSLDMNKWNYDWGHGGQYGNGGWGNGEFQFYHPDNVSVRGGKLILEARKVDNCPGGCCWFPTPADPHRGNYTSGKITTAGTLNLDGSAERNKYAVEAGHRLEASMKMPRGRALWPAFWMLGASVNEWNAGDMRVTGWPRCGEIDIMETSGDKPRRYGVHLHAGRSYMYGYWNEGRAYDHPTDLSDDFYVYGVKWDDQDIIFYLQSNEEEYEDRTTFFEWTLNWAAKEEIEANNHGGDPVGHTEAFFEQGHCITFNMAISGAYVADHYNNGNNVHGNPADGVSWGVPPYDWAFSETGHTIRAQDLDWKHTQTPCAAPDCAHGNGREIGTFLSGAQLYRDRTLQVDWVRVFKWNRDQ
ncbi:MAG: glycoside hydrolase family 16 protein [Treponema sp.]|nr:glycoside hydrolase family 16 protein [Treponema sp.]